ncbi:hypothetical protein AtEden1_Chr3g0192211 [Arabidopsis thaliana]
MKFSRRNHHVWLISYYVSTSLTSGYMVINWQPLQLAIELLTIIIAKWHYFVTIISGGCNRNHYW